MLKMKKIILITLVCFLSLTFGFSQETGTVDTDFGTDGVIEHTLTIGNTLYGVILYQLYVLPDDKMLAVGVATSGCSSTSSSSGLIMRLLPNGEIDTTFHGTGYLRMSAPIVFYQIIPTGTNHFYLISGRGVVKIDTEGNLDTTYGDNGHSYLSYGSSGVVDAQGNVYITGRKSSGYTPVITKLNPQGEVDTSFGTDGELTFNTEFRLNRMAFNSTGDIIVVGREYLSYNNTNLFVMKVTPNGALDSTFADDGIFMYDPWSNSDLSRLHIYEDDKILAFGDGKLTGNSEIGIVLFKLNADGSLDTSFNDDGIHTFQVFSDSTPRSIHPQEDSGFIISGTGYNNMYTIKIDANGEQDLSFGTDGAIITPSFEWTGANAGSVIVDNKVLLYGFSGFAHCAQTKYKAHLTQYYLPESSLSTDDVSFSTLDAYPNPVVDKLQIPVANGDQDVRLKLFTLSGREVQVRSNRNTSNETVEMDLSQMSSGVYFLVKEEKGTRQIRKIIKL
jgi:uncharacterized delta-60 repeat protein